jgi:hypothetical protein
MPLKLQSIELAEDPTSRAPLVVSDGAEPLAFWQRPALRVPGSARFGDLIGGLSADSRSASQVAGELAREGRGTSAYERGERRFRLLCREWLEWIKDRVHMAARALASGEAREPSIGAEDNLWLRGFVVERSTVLLEPEARFHRDSPWRPQRCSRLELMPPVELADPWRSGERYADQACADPWVTGLPEEPPEVGPYGGLYYGWRAAMLAACGGDETLPAGISIPVPVEDD